MVRLDRDRLIYSPMTAHLRATRVTGDGMFGPLEIGLTMLLIYLGIPIFGGYLLLRFVRAYERRKQIGPEATPTDDRMRRLEEGMASISAQVDRLTEQQEFTMRLLKDRASNS
jgi:hypothetical protein